MEVTLKAFQANRFKGDYKLPAGPIIVGRDDSCDLRFSDARMSREHCRIAFDSDACKVIDLSSTNGTYVNGRRVQKAKLIDGDRITVGRTHLVFAIPVDASDETTTGMEADMTTPNEPRDTLHGGRHGPDGRWTGRHDPLGDDYDDLRDDSPIARGALARKRPAPLPVVVGPRDILGSSDRYAGSDSGMSMVHLLQYKKTITLIALAIFIPSLIGIWMLLKPRYSAAGQVRVRPIIPHLVFETEESGTIPFYQSYLNTQVGVIRSPTVLQRVLDQSEVQATEWYSRSDPFWQQPRTKLERLGMDLMVQPRGLTELIDVAVLDTSPDDATVIVNVVLDQYIKYLSERSEEGSDMMFRQLARQFEQLDRTIKGREDVAAELRKELGTANPRELVSGKRVRLDQMQSELDGVRRKLALASLRKQDLENRLEPVRDSIVKTANMEAAGPRYQTDPEWNRLNLELKLAKHKVAIESQRLGYAHPTMLAIKQQVAFADELLIARQQQLDSQWPLASPLVATSGGLSVVGLTPAQELDELNWQVKLMAQEEKLLISDISREKSVWADTFDRAEILDAEQSSIDQKKQLYEAVRSRLEQKHMERNVPGSIEVLAKAVTPSLPASDRRLAFSILTLFVAVGKGMSVAYLRAVSDHTIHQTGELTGAAPAPFLGLLPQIAAVTDRLVEDDPDLCESIRMARTSLLQQMGTSTGNVVVVTSAERGVGKTTVSTMLARSLARSGKRALLIDADLRNPSIADHMDLHPLVGFADAISGDATDDQAILSTDDPKLDVLPGRINGEGYDPELIANGAFSSSLARWRSTYDVILLDSPPVLAVADASILARHADGTILIAWAGRTQRSEILHAMESLNSAGGSLMGTIFVQQKQRNHYGQPYAYAYGA